MGKQKNMETWEKNTRDKMETRDKKTWGKNEHVGGKNMGKETKNMETLEKNTWEKNRLSGRTNMKTWAPPPADYLVGVGFGEPKFSNFSS